MKQERKGAETLRYVAISGTVGAGKTTLLRKLTQRLGDRAAFHEERPDENPYINIYYADTKRWSFHSQAAFLAQYFDDFIPREKAGGKDFYIYDRSVTENLIIAKYRLNQGDLDETEYAMLEKLANGIASLLPPIDKFIYLDCPPLIIEDHMLTRGREYEEDLDLFYVYEVKKLYDEWAQTLPKEKTLVLDMTKEYDVDEILKFLEN